jgi:hypothetical protein
MEVRGISTAHITSWSLRTVLNALFTFNSHSGFVTWVSWSSPTLKMSKLRHQTLCNLLKIMYQGGKAESWTGVLWLQSWGCESLHHTEEVWTWTMNDGLGGGEAGRGGQGREMVPTVYAHVNKWIKKKTQIYHLYKKKERNDGLVPIPTECTHAESCQRTVIQFEQSSNF